MADSTQEPRPDDWDEEVGGPVKSFLEHLEDLRWMLIKSGSALLVATIICLYGTSLIISILKRPLTQAALIQVGHGQRVLVRFATNNLATFESSTNYFNGLDLGTNWFVLVQLEPVQTESNTLLSIRVDKNPPRDAAASTATDLVYLDPAQPFLSSLHVALYAGFLLAAPFIFYFLAQFILPALKVKEKKYVLRACGVGVGLFWQGFVSAISLFWRGR